MDRVATRLRRGGPRRSGHRATNGADRARNAWATFTGALKAACSARDRSLRVLAAPIHFGVLPPKRGESRQRPWLYPREWLAFVASAAPVPFRQVCAIALYTGLRPGELRALTWADVDLGARTISVSKAIDSETDEVKPPKTRQGQRIIPIHPSLLPLLEALEGEDDALVLGAFNASEDHMAPSFREHLANAGIDRPRLTADNPAIPLPRLGNDIASPCRSRREDAGESCERVARRRDDRREPRHEFHRGHHAMPSAPPADVLEAVRDAPAG